MISFFLVVDTKCLNIWNQLSKITSCCTENLYRFQGLWKKNNIKSTCLTNYAEIIDVKNHLKKLISNFFQYRISILRSRLSNLNELKNIVYWNMQYNASHLEYMIHSSEVGMNESHLITSVTEEKMIYNSLGLCFVFLIEQNIDSYTFKGYIKYVLTEIMNNVCDHSESTIGGYVTAQFYPSKHKIQVSIADTGIGFLEKMQRKFSDITTEEEAIKYAVQKEVTGSLPDMYGAERNAGYGLYVISKIVEMTGTALYILSNNTLVKFYDGTSITTIINTDWQGSLIVFEIDPRYIDSSMSDFMKDRIYSEEEELIKLF